MQEKKEKPLSDLEAASLYLFFQKNLAKHNHGGFPYEN